eukprot:TRINITY_DN5660_c0_g1_i10.p1 TRINITY_DN5660_c0_g1~~TRINITY_DN5660_c0_g1_i10.p1  ORF type:complete len:214 (+),score=-13.17 TRINITY_DN5660_c0_g1_i10:161-802(+)
MFLSWLIFLIQQSKKVTTCYQKRVKKYTHKRTTQQYCQNGTEKSSTKKCQVLHGKKQQEENFMRYACNNLQYFEIKVKQKAKIKPSQRYQYNIKIYYIQTSSLFIHQQLKNIISVYFLKLKKYHFQHILKKQLVQTARSTTLLLSLKHLIHLYYCMNVTWSTPLPQGGIIILLYNNFLNFAFCLQVRGSNNRRKIICYNLQLNNNKFILMYKF